MNNLNYGGNGNTVPGTAAARELQVFSKMSALGASLELMEKDFIELQERLRSVTSEELPRPGVDAPKGMTMPLCPLADQLQTFIGKAEFLRERISSLRNRLEV